MIHFLNDFQSGENHRNTIREAVKKCHKMSQNVGVSTENQQVQGTCLYAENES